MVTKVLVVMGGLSSERDISRLSGTGVATALQEAGYDVISYNLTADIDEFVRVLRDEKPDVVFNALHGQYGEDGCVQGLLELMHIPYTHSGVMASAVGMNKDMTRRVMQSVGIEVADGGLITREDMVAGRVPSMPYVVKPNGEGSSVGVSIIRTESDKAALLAAWPAGQKMLVESYIAGRELSVAVRDGQALGVVEIIPKQGYYDFVTKYTDGAASHIIPAQIPEEVYQQAMAWAALAHKTLGCRGVSRSDFRLDDVTNPVKPRLVFLEINTNPGMTALSLVPEIARICHGISYRDLAVRLVEEAVCGK